MANENNFYDTDIKYIKGVGDKRAKLFARLDVKNIYDILRYYPRGYVNYSDARKIEEVRPDEVNCVLAKVCSPVRESYIRKNMTVFKLAAKDETGVINITIFNNKYLAESLEEGGEYFFIGKVTEDYGVFQMTPGSVRKFSEELFYSPIYSLTAGLNSFTVERIVKNALSLFKTKNLSDPIPDEIRSKFKLCHEQYAVESIHFPKNENDIEIARRRFIFEELFLLQCGMLAMKERTREENAQPIKGGFDSDFISGLPFELTNAQKKVIDECMRDMGKKMPMNRLVQGDVGSGKTVVAAALMYSTVKNGFQCVLMAPTEILAKQHFETFSSLMPDDVRIALLTGSTRNKKKLKEKLAAGEIDVVIGTHAVITDDTDYKSLALVVVDEQHRFGVKQRSALSSKGENPHVLVMSATPIPRTLSLIIYGELDISIIDEMPKGRKKVRTYYVNSSYEKRIYAFIRKNLEAGRQSYVVCPLVEENEEIELTAAEKYYELLSEKVFTDFKVGLLHGKMKAKEKEKVMEAFSSGEIRLLVSTTVIEVGIDVKNATIMLVRDADRFGLSQLHQLRGRVGRGSDESYCILMTDNQSESVKKRMDLMCRTDNGFVLADEDLKIRGPGEFFGSRQSGLPNLKIASFANDLDFVRKAASAARYVFSSDPKLEKSSNASLKDAVKRMFDKNESTVFN